MTFGNFFRKHLEELRSWGRPLLFLGIMGFGAYVVFPFAIVALHHRALPPAESSKCDIRRDFEKTPSLSRIDTVQNALILGNERSLLELSTIVNELETRIEVLEKTK